MAAGGKDGGGSAGTRDALRRLDALAQVGLRLARQAPSGRILLAQLALGTDPRWVPRPWGDDLLAELDRAAAQSAEPLSRKQVEQTLRTAWGAKPSEELDDLDPEPVAVTPTSQVHRGELDGAPVAVKVQRPGLARAVRQDLALLDSLIAPLAAAFPALDAGAVLREVGERTRDEFDLEHEAASARQLRRRFRDHPRLCIPAPHTRLAAEDVLVREWIDGEPLADGAPDARDAAAAALVDYLCTGAATGLTNAGLTPADVLITPDGRTAVLDHGVCCAVDRERLAHYRAAVDALADPGGDSQEAFAGALATLGLLEPAPAAVARELLRDLLGELLEPGASALDVDAVRELGLRAHARSGEVVSLVREGAPAPQDLWPMRGVAQLFATIALVGARGDWVALATAALDGGA